MDWTLPSCRWVEGEKGVSNKEDGGTEGRMDEWRGLPLLRFSWGPCFLPVRTEREGGMLIKWLKGKIRSNQTEGEQKIQLIETHRCVCVVCVVGRNGPVREERHISCCRKPTATGFGRPKIIIFILLRCGNYFLSVI